MLTRRRFLFGAAAGTAILPLTQSAAGQWASALLTPSPAPVLAADIVQGGPSGHSLIRTMTEIARHAKRPYQFVQEGKNDLVTYMWHVTHESIIRNTLSDLVHLMEASKIQDFEAEKLSIHKWCEEKAQHLNDPTFDSMFYYGPRDLMDKFTSRETVLAQIPEILDRAVLALEKAEEAKPSNLQSRPVSMDQLHMILSPHQSPTLQNATTYRGRGNTFAEHVKGFCYKYTADNLKFLAELQFLRDNNFLSRTFTLPEREQAILDTLEANPANWSLLLKNQGYMPDGASTVNRLNAAFPERAEKTRIYEAILKRLGDINDPIVSVKPLHRIDVPWNIVVEMNDKPDAFLPIMQAAHEELRQHHIKAYRNSIANSCKGKTSFTQTSSGEVAIQGLQGTLRGFFTVFPDKQVAFNVLTSSFSAAVNLAVNGDDILIEAKPEMNEQDRLLIEDLSGIKLDQVAFKIPMKEPAPVVR